VFLQEMEMEDHRAAEHHDCL